MGPAARPTKYLVIITTVRVDYRNAKGGTVNPVMKRYLATIRGPSRRLNRIAVVRCRDRRVKLCGV